VPLAEQIFDEAKGQGSEGSGFPSYTQPGPKRANAPWYWNPLDWFVLPAGGEDGGDFVPPVDIPPNWTPSDLSTPGEPHQLRNYDWGDGDSNYRLA
jgi:hypothetical protein